MSVEENKAIVLMATEALSKQDLSSMNNFFSHDFYNYTYQFQVLEDLKHYYSKLF